MLGYKQEKKTGAQTAKEGAGRLDKFGKAVKDEKGGNIVDRIQKYGKDEAERQRKKKEEAAKETKSTAPQKGFIERMMDKYRGKKKEDK